MSETLPYYLPLGDGKFARLTLPADLTEEDADRLCGMIRALVFTPPEIQAG